MARAFLAAIEQAELAVEGVKDASGRPMLKLPPKEGRTPEQQELIVDLVCLAIGYPRNYGTLCRLLREQEAK